MKRILKAVSLSAITVLSASVVSGCGQDQFRIGTSEARIAAPGTFVIPAKVDILLVEDDTGSRFEAHEAIKQQMPGFLAGLEAKGWNYHFSSVPLTTLRSPNPFSQIAVSKYDGNWDALGLWKPPFPGASPSASGMSVASSFFTGPDSFGEFLIDTDISNEDNAWEPGLDTIEDVLHHPVITSSGFLRDDALTIVFVVGNGQDTSGAVAYTRSDGWEGFKDHTPISHYTSSFSSVKPAPELLKFYAAVAYQQSSDCLGSSSRVGSRYIQTADSLGGKSYNICSQPLDSILADLDQDLQAIKLNYRTSYLVIGHKPDLSTLRVVRYENGDPNQASEVLEDPVNGWTYEGFGTVHTIDWPTPLNEETGYLIRLHGAARLTGGDTAEVFYTPDLNAN